MRIDVVEVTGDELENWDACVERSPHSSPFHRYSVLELIASYSGTELRPLVAYKGQEAIGLLPLFESRKGPLTTIHSPPPGMQFLQLGPLRLNFEQCKQRTVERDNERFIEAALEWLERTIDPDLISMHCIDRYVDVRPFIWHEYGFKFTPQYTYVVDLTREEDELWQLFSKDVRRNVRDCEEAGVEIRMGDEEDVGKIVTQLLARHRGPELLHDITPDLVIDLIEAFDPSVVHPYVCYHEDEFVGGTINLDARETTVAWLGGTAPEADLSVNEFLDVRAMLDSKERGITQYNLYGATARSLSQYKSKFNPELRPQFKIQWMSPKMNVVSGVYRRLPTAIRSAVR